MARNPTIWTPAPKAPFGARCSEFELPLLALCLSFACPLLPLLVVAVLLALSGVPQATKGPPEVLVECALALHERYEGHVCAVVPPAYRPLQEEFPFIHSLIHSLIMYFNILQYPLFSLLSDFYLPRF